MYSTDNRSRMIGLALSTAIAGALVAGCAKAPPLASASAGQAEAALAAGQAAEAITLAEAAVSAEPHNAAFRATLGSAYLDAGRFASAVTAFDEARELGDAGGRTALSLALALIGDGKPSEALAVLNQSRDVISQADLGLAYTLTGEPRRGIDTLTVALRNGENTSKVRQNLAYSYAMNGQWREARIMASQDVPANEIGDRMTQWAAATTVNGNSRVAGLLGVPSNAIDPGQPSQLALSGSAPRQELASIQMPASAASAELPPVKPQAPAVAAAPEPAAAPAPAAARTTTFVQTPAPSVAVAPRETAPAQASTVQPGRFEQVFVAPSRVATAKAPAPKAKSAPAARPAAKAPAKPAPALAMADGTHRVQLGSFSSEAGAKRASSIYLKRYPELANHQMVISKANIGGKTYWRVAAAGYQSKAAKSMCGKVKTSGHGCLAYAEGTPLPGTVATDRRLALR